MKYLFYNNKSKEKEDNERRQQLLPTAAVEVVTAIAVLE